MLHDGAGVEIQEYGEPTTRWEDSEKSEPLTVRNFVRRVGEELRMVIEVIQKMPPQAAARSELIDSFPKSFSFLRNESIF